MSTQQARAKTCLHHWMIPPADGPVSLGVCQFCRETREFKNSFEIPDYGRDPSRKTTLDYGGSSHYVA